MMTSIASLMLAGTVLSQTATPAAPITPITPITPVAPAAPVAPPPVAPVAPAPIAPMAPIAPDLHLKLEQSFLLQEKQLEKQMEMLERQFNQKDFQERIMAEALEKADRMMARQFPVPPVPPVPPRDPRQKPRERERRRIPEGWVEATEPFTRSFPVTKAATLMLSNIAGNIQITPGAADKIEVEAMKHAWGPNPEQAKQRLPDALIESYATGNRVEVRVEHGERRDGRGIEIEFNVKVPADATIDLRTVSGDIRVTNVKGEVRVQGISGNLSLEGTARLAAVKTVSGGITINNAGADGSLSLSTVNGDLLIQTLNTRALDVNTVNGDVKISGWSGDRAMIRTLDGDLDLQTSLVKGGRYEIESHSGSINLSLPEQPGFELEANTFNGRIRIDFPIKSEGPIRDGDRGPRAVRGTYGDGSSSLRLQTFNGNLTVTRR